MSRTLFLYIFKDLLRIFFMTSGALAGIMSFGGLLRPLTEHGLDAGQAARMLSYFMPAMTTYSLPIAALFATTVVYGRLSADNEITAMRAAGIAYHPMGGIATPALVLGLSVALMSLLLLCFIVPVFTLKVEQVIYSNLAKFIATEIEKTHQIKFADTTIFAQEATVAEDDPKHPDEQMVSLGGLMIVSYRKEDSQVAGAPPLLAPREFYLAKQATVFIRRNKTDDYVLDAVLEDPGGAMFPRSFTAGEGTQGGLSRTHYGPIIMESMIHENTKFMDIRRLHELYRDIGKSRRVQIELTRIIRSAQEARYLNRVSEALAVPNGKFHFDSASGEKYDLISPRGSVAKRNDRLVITPARLQQLDADGKATFTWDASEIELSAKPVGDDTISVEAHLYNVVAQTPEGPTAKASFSRPIVVAMPAELGTLENRDIDYYRRSDIPGVVASERSALLREMLKVGNSIQSEMHSRVSFAISCLILVIVGCFLGMMFKTGNFLTAFALSVIPALVAIALNVAGQHTCENVPWKITDAFQNPLNLGLAVIWTGNVVVLTLAIVLGMRMQKQ